MTPEQMQQFDVLPTIEARAVYLLEIGVTARHLDIEGNYQAKVGNLLLPIYGATAEIAIKRGTEWLRQKGGVNVH